MSSKLIVFYSCFVFFFSLDLTVVEQRFVIEVYDEFVPSGSTAILRCHIPAFMRDLLDIVAWLEGSTNYILPDDSHHYSERSGKGQAKWLDSKLFGWIESIFVDLTFASRMILIWLLICFSFFVFVSKIFTNIICYRVVNCWSTKSIPMMHWKIFAVKWNIESLRRKFWAQILAVSLSLVCIVLFFCFFSLQIFGGKNLFKFFLIPPISIETIEMISNQPPRIIETNRVIVTEEGYNAEIVCLAQGYPEPQYLWYKDSDLLTDRLSDTTTTTINGNSLLSNYLIPRIRILSNSILIEKVNINDAGIYRCIVNNSLGSELSETQLIVRCKLKFFAIFFAFGCSNLSFFFVSFRFLTKILLTIADDFLNSVRRKILL